MVAIAAAGTLPGWRAANVAVRQGDNLIDLGATEGRAAIGIVAEAVPEHPGQIIDAMERVVVELLHDGMEIPAPIGGVLAANAPAI